MKSRLRRFLTSTTARLATTYLAIIMLMSIGFSVVFYNTTSRELDRQVPPDGYTFRATTGTVQPAQNMTVTPKTDDSTTRPRAVRLRDFLQQRTDEGRHDLIIHLVIVNASTLALGAILSFLLARRTLQPIEANMEAQRQFVSDASHELRTPLTAIQTSNEVALRNARFTLTEAKAVIADNTMEAAKLKQLSDGLLDLARNDGHHQKLSDISLQAAVQDALNHVVAIAQAKKIGVEDITDNVSVISNQAILSQILVILLDNAIKYSPRGSTIHLSSTVKGNQIQLQVRDEGVGIRASDIPHLFRRFYRADNARNNSHVHGYGLGLAIANSLAQAHGASLSVESELHKGSTFSIKLRTATISKR